MGSSVVQIYEKVLHYGMQSQIVIQYLQSWTKMLYTTPNFFPFPLETMLVCLVISISTIMLQNQLCSWGGGILQLVYNILSMLVCSNEKKTA